MAGPRRGPGARADPGDANKDERLFRIRWVWLDAPPGDRFRPRVSVKEPASLGPGRDVVLKRDEEGEGGRLITYVAVDVGEERRGAPELSESLAVMKDYLKSTRIGMVRLTGTIIALTCILEMLLGYLIVGRPMGRLVEKARRMASGDLRGTPALERYDEIALLGAEMDAMCRSLFEARERIREETASRVAAMEQLRHADRLKTVGRLASGIAHELGTPLSVVSGRGGKMKGRVLIVDEDKDMCELIAAALKRGGGGIEWRTRAEEAFSILKEREFDAVPADLNMPGMGGVELCERITANWPDIPVVMMTAFGSLETAVASIRAGACDFVTKPIEMDVLEIVVDRAVRHRSLKKTNRILREAVERSHRFGKLPGGSPPMRDLFDELDRIGDTETSVLVTGESGTGKELVARALHGRSRRREGPFVPVNLSALPEMLLESELFGRKRGAFTGEFAARAGKRIAGFSDPVAEKLLDYSWPGNVRELRNAMERAVALTRYETLTVEDLPEKIRSYSKSRILVSGTDPAELVPLEELERRYIFQVLDAVGGNKSLAARVLGVDRKTLYRKLQGYGSKDDGRKGE